MFCMSKLFDHQQLVCAPNEWPATATRSESSRPFSAGTAFSILALQAGLPDATVRL